MALRIPFTREWKRDGAEDRKPYLTAVRMAGQDEVDLADAGMQEQLIDKVRFVYEQDGGRVWRFRQCDVEVRLAEFGIIKPGQEDVVSFMLDASGLIDKHRQAVGFHVKADCLRAYGSVVIAEDAVADGAAKT